MINILKWVVFKADSHRDLSSCNTYNAGDIPSFKIESDLADHYLAQFECYQHPNGYWLVRRLRAIEPIYGVDVHRLSGNSQQLLALTGLDTTDDILHPGNTLFTLTKENIRLLFLIPEYRKQLIKESWTYRDWEALKHLCINPDRLIERIAVPSKLSPLWTLPMFAFPDIWFLPLTMSSTSKDQRLCLIPETELEIEIQVNTVQGNPKCEQLRVYGTSSLHRDVCINLYHRSDEPSVGRTDTAYCDKNEKTEPITIDFTVRSRKQFDTLVNVCLSSKRVTITVSLKTILDEADLYPKCDILDNLADVILVTDMEWKVEDRKDE